MKWYQLICWADNCRQMCNQPLRDRPGWTDRWCRRYRAVEGVAADDADYQLPIFRGSYLRMKCL